MTPAAAASKWVNREILYAQAQRKTIIPLLLRGSVFFSLNDLQYVEVTGNRLPRNDLIASLCCVTSSVDDRQAGLATRGTAFEAADLGELIEIGAGAKDVVGIRFTRGNEPPLFHQESLRPDRQSATPDHVVSRKLKSQFGGQGLPTDLLAGLTPREIIQVLRSRRSRR